MGEFCDEAPPTTHCVLTYDLLKGNANEGDNYKDCNMRILDTALNMGTGTRAVGPGTLVLRVPTDGAQGIATGQAEVLYYELPQQFQFKVTLGPTVTTDVTAFAGTADNTEALALGTLSFDGASPTINWDPCTYPEGYNNNEHTFTPDVAQQATGDGCLAPYRSVGVVNCNKPWLALAGCSAGNLNNGDNPQDETWKQRLETLVFNDDMSTFQMSLMLVPNETPSRTYLSWGGVLVDTVCE